MFYAGGDSFTFSSRSKLTFSVQVTPTKLYYTVNVANSLIHSSSKSVADFSELIFSKLKIFIENLSLMCFFDENARKTSCQLALPIAGLS